MTAKEYLSQAWYVDKMIDAKLEEASGLRALATKATPVLSDMPSGATRNIHSREQIIVRIIDLEREVNADIDRLLALKREISTAIKAVPNRDYRLLLELRYLAFKPWAEIACLLKYGRKYIFRLHENALKKITVPAKEDTSRTRKIPTQ